MFVLLTIWEMEGTIKDREATTKGVMVGTVSCRHAVDGLLFQTRLYRQGEREYGNGGGEEDSYYSKMVPRVVVRFGESGLPSELTVSGRGVPIEHVELYIQR